MIEKINSHHYLTKSFLVKLLLEMYNTKNAEYVCTHCFNLIDKNDCELTYKSLDLKKAVLD